MTVSSLAHNINMYYVHKILGCYELFQSTIKLKIKKLFETFKCLIVRCQIVEIDARKIKHITFGRVQVLLGKESREIV